MSRWVTVSLTNMTVLDVLDAVIKEHGQLHWNLSYRIPPDIARPESAKYEHAIPFVPRQTIGWRMVADVRG